MTGDAATAVFLGVFVGLLSTPWWPATGQRGRPRFESLQGMVMIWFGVTFTTHLTWELAWVLLRKRIIAAPDAIWSYPWWAYIDGGGARYASDSGQLITLESLTAVVGSALLGQADPLRADRQSAPLDEAAGTGWKQLSSGE